MSDSKWKIYTSESCPYCERAKKLLKSRNIDFEEKKVGWDDDAEWDRLFKLTGLKTVPQIFFGDRLIGGYQDLVALDAAGEWVTLK